MLTAEANQRITQVGAGTPMGELMRRYWIPIRPLAQLIDEEVMAVRILGEDLVLFRTRNGEAYSVKEMGGLIWAYMGPKPVPILPPWDLFVIPNSIRQIGVAELPCNWLQCHENTGDPTHSAYLHGHYFKYILEKESRLNNRAADNPMHTLYGRIKLENGIESLWANSTSHGMEKGINYSKALGAERDYQSRHSTVIFPFYTQTGGPGQVRQFGPKGRSLDCQPLLRDAMQGGLSFNHVWPGQVIVTGRDNQIKGADTGLRGLDMNDGGRPAASAFCPKRVGYGAAAAGNQQIRPGRANPIAVRPQRGQRPGPPTRRQPGPRRAGANLFDRMGHANRLRQGNGLVLHPRMARRHDPAGSFGTGRRRCC